MAQDWRTVRVFISSTFRDMQAERNHLVRFVFSRLREQLLLRRIHLVDVDLRWGVTGEQDASEVCREIISECRPRFLCVLGGRYGTIPEGKQLSITADEVHFGVLEARQKMYALFYFRVGSVTNLMDKSSPGSVREPRHSKKALKLARLKRDIRKAKRRPVLYHPRWKANEQKLLDLKAFGDRVERDILDTIDDEFGVQPAPQLDEFAEEDAAMEAFAEKRSARFVLGSREAVLKELLAHTSATGGSGYLYLTGAPGSGKSALLAHLSQHSTLNDQLSTILIRHFVGASAGSTNVRRMLRRVCHELKKACSEITEDIPDDAEKLRVVLPDFLRRASSSKRVVILLDAVNQLDATSYSGGLHWLPEELPANARVILSALDGPALEELRRYPHKPRKIKLKPLTAADGEAIIDQFRQRYRKKFEPDQRAGLLGKTDASTPLYLLAALEELRTLGTDDEINRRIAELQPTTHKLFSWILERLENDDGFRDATGRRVGPDLVSRFAALLGASRYGLSQRELADMLEVGDHQGNVAALLYLLRPYLMRRGELLDFYHTQFKDAVVERYLSNEDERNKMHQAIATYFETRWRQPEHHALSELPYHLLEGKQFETLFALARNPTFLDMQKRIFADDPDRLLQTLQLALRGATEAKNAGAIAEFYIGHANQVQEWHRQSPLQVLAGGRLQNSWLQADLWTIKACALWYLLIVWALKGSGRVQEAEATLRRLSEKDVPELYNMDGTLAAYLLTHALDVSKDLFFLLVNKKRMLADSSIYELCEYLAHSGETSVIQEIMGSLSTLEQEFDRNLLMDRLAVLLISTLAKTGRISTAHRLLETQCPPLPWRSRALADVITHNVLAGQSDVAYGIVGGLSDELERAGGQQALAVALGRSGALNDALASADGIEWAGSKVKALSSLAPILNQAGRCPAAREALSVAEKELGNIGVGFQYEALQQIAIAYARVGDLPRALQTLERIHRLDDRSGIADSWLDDPLRDIAEALALKGDANSALKIMKMVVDESRRIETAIKIGLALAQRGRQDQAESIFADALRMAPEHPAKFFFYSGPSIRMPHLDIAVAYCSTGNTEKAQSIISHTIQQLHRKDPDLNCDEFLNEIAKGAARGKNFLGALWLAQKIRGRTKLETLVYIATEQVQSDLLSEAVDTLRGIDQEGDGDLRRAVSLLCDIAVSQYQAGIDDTVQATLSKAGELSERIQFSIDLEDSLHQIAVAHAKLGNRAESMEKFIRLLSQARKIPNPVARSESIVRIAESQTRAGDFSAVFKTAEELEWNQDQLLELISHGSRHEQQHGLGYAGHGCSVCADHAHAEKLKMHLSRPRVYGEVAVAQAKAGDFDSAKKSAAKILWPQERLHALCKIYEAEVAARRHAEARQTIQFAKEVANDIQVWEETDKDGVLAGLALALAQIQEFSDALAVAQKIGNASQLAEVVARIGTTQSRSGFKEAAQEVFKDAISTAKGIAEPKQTVIALENVALACAESDQAFARRAIKDAVRVADRITEGWERADALLKIAVTQSKVFGAKTARDTFRTARDAVYDSGDVTRLGNVAVAQIRAGIPKDALETARLIPMGYGEELLEVAEAFAEIAHEDFFNQHLVSCAYRADTPTRMCGLLSSIVSRAV